MKPQKEKGVIPEAKGITPLPGNFAYRLLVQSSLKCIHSIHNFYPIHNNMKLYKTASGNIVEFEQTYYKLQCSWDVLVNRNKLHAYLLDALPGAEKLDADAARLTLEEGLLPPVGQQEVWAAGVTYLRSRDARKEESLASGGADLYDKVYEAERPELFFKSMPHRVSGHGQTVYIRRDSGWNVPEPELTLFINAAGSIEGYTIGNDMSSRSIEGENALYLPQAKVYERSAAIGPCLYVPSNAIPSGTVIEIVITRRQQTMYREAASIDRMKRSFTELAAYLFLECDFPDGCFLMKDTCLVPPNTFTLQENDVVEITISGIGTLVNHVLYKPVAPKLT